MVEERGALRAIYWQDAFPALRLFRALRLAIHFRALLLAAAALVIVSAGWHVCDAVFSGADDPKLRQQIEMNRAWPWETPAISPPLEHLTSIDNWRERSPLVLAWNAISAPFRQIYATDITFTHFIYLLVGALWTLAVWALFGGAITRIAAVSLARQENVSASQLTRFVLPRWPAYFVAPLFPILGTFLLAALLAGLGLLMRTSAGILTAGIVWPLVLLIGFLMAFLLIGLFFAWPLMWATVSAEGTDAFGALSHSYSYTYQRPLQYLLYAAIAALVGVLGWYLVSLFASEVVALANWGVSWGSGASTVQNIAAASDVDSSIGNLGGTLIRFWNGCVFLLATAYLFSYFWAASTVIYFLLRRLVDGTELDEVFMPEERALHGLPPLKTGPDGVPEVADEPAAAE
jgi:hypothetical protein